MLDLQANPNRLARGTVIESQLDKGRGITATVLVQKGTLSIGDPFVAGNYQGKVRAMFNERNQKIDTVGPAEPALILGFEGIPQAGDSFVVVESERLAREVSIKRLQLKREQDFRSIKHITLDEIANQIRQGGYKELPLVVKGDVDGSVEALADSLMKLSTNEVAVNVIHRGVGAISEGDVLLAAASQAIIVGFHVRPNLNAKKTAEKEQVDIRLYNVIYDAINEIKSALEGMLAPVISEETVATVEVRDTFKVPKVGTVAGCYVQDGKISRSNKIRLFREGVVIYTGELDTLKRFKDDVKEVDAGYECGLKIANYNDIKIGDIVEGYKIIETKKKLS
jgi:translation initiation factor IF-2